MVAPNAKDQRLRPSTRWLWKALVGLLLLGVAGEYLLLSFVPARDPVLLRGASPQLDADDTRVSPADLLHLSLLHGTCTSGRDPIISWQFGADGQPDESVLIERDDPRALDELRRCPDVDIYLPGSLRGSGYCEDGCAYTKYMQSRLLPGWALENSFFDQELNRTVGYHDLCPRTPMLFMNHYWDGQHERPAWPKDKPIYVMPNIEMGELKETDYWRVDAVLCKTRGCFDRVTTWYEQQGNPRDAKVFYTRHTTSDVANYARKTLGDTAVRPKDFRNVRFVHTAGGSVQKNTVKIVKTWLGRPDFPLVDVFMDTGLFNGHFREQFGAQLNHSTNLKVHTEPMDALKFGKMLAEAAFFLCPSIIEGYGHYINQARASGGVIVTTDAHPMNELISAPSTGVYASTKRETHPDMILGGGYKGEHGLRDFDGLVASTSPSAIGAAVDFILDDTTPVEREIMAKRVQAAYHENSKFFAEQMKIVCAYARNQTQSKAVPIE